MIYDVRAPDQPYYPHEVEVRDLETDAVIVGVMALDTDSGELTLIDFDAPIAAGEMPTRSEIRAFRFCRYPSGEEIARTGTAPRQRFVGGNGFRNPIDG